jgi:peptidylprolyl isomerase
MKQPLVWVAVLAAVLTSSVNAWTQQTQQQHSKPPQKPRNSIAQALTTALLTTAILTTGSLDTSQSTWWFPPAAVAKEMASGSGSRVNKDADSLLRYGLPIKNKDVRDFMFNEALMNTEIDRQSKPIFNPLLTLSQCVRATIEQVRKLQSTLEDIKTDIGSKRKSAALDGVKKSKTLLNSSDKYVKSCRQATICSEIIAQMQADLDPLAASLKDSQEAFQGSEQERSALDKAYAAQEKVVNQLTSLEEQMIPVNYKTPVPDEYSDLAQLRGRATVEMIIKKANSNVPFDVNGENFSQAKLVMIVDGYAAPVTSGNFVDLVQRGFYNNMRIQRSDGFVVQTGDPEGEADGYVGTGSKSVGNGKHGERLIPLEIFVRDDAGPFYESTIEDEGRGGQATVLPFSSYGAMGWAREEYDVNSGSSQFFWLLFDSDLTPAGKNVLDGRYPW